MTTHKKHHHVVKEPEANSPFDFNLNNIANILGKINVMDMAPILEKMASREAEGNNKGKEEIIRSIKTLLNSDKGELIAILIEAYSISRISGKK
jgi:hypothetical protein